MQFETKRCTKCGETKVATGEFWHTYTSKKGECLFESKCKVCRSLAASAHRLAHPERYAQQIARHRASLTPEEKALRGRKYFETYVAKDQEAFKAKRRKVAARRRKSIKGALTNRIQTAVWHALRGKGLKKQNRLFEMVGWSIDELKVHLEERFEEGMSWGNMGEWHIDHVLPISLMDFTSEDSEEFRMLWALRNLAPLWAKDNVVKLANYPWKLPQDYKNPKLRAMYPRAISDIELFNINGDAIRAQGLEPEAIGFSTPESVRLLTQQGLSFAPVSL